jgi:hypothetical protein
MKTSVKVYARRFEILCMVFIPLILIIPAFVWFFGDKLMDSTYGIDLKSFSLMKRFALFLADFAGDLLVVYGLCVCIKIARLFQKSEIFTLLTTALFSRLSRLTAWWGAYRMIWIICFYGMVMPNYPIRLAIFSIGASGLFYLFIFVFLSMLATLVSKASVLQGDQDLTV